MQFSNNNNSKPITIHLPGLPTAESYLEYGIPTTLEKFWLISLDTLFNQSKSIVDLETKISTLMGRQITKADLEAFKNRRHLNVQLSTKNA
jgi:hypothetical protein